MQKYNILKIAIPLLAFLLVIVVAGYIGKKRTSKKGTADTGAQLDTGKALGLREAYNLAKPTAKAIIGSDAEIFNAITTTINSDGKSSDWYVSFCSPTKLQGIAVRVTNGKVANVLGPEQINPKEEESCDILNANWIDSTQVAYKTGCTSAAFHIADYAKQAPSLAAPPEPGSTDIGIPPEEEIATWELICNGKFWAFDVYSGELVKQGETTMKVGLPVVK